jgi:hypothetical protein
MEPFTKLHVQILLSKMVLLKKNIGTLLKLLVLSRGEQKNRTTEKIKKTKKKITKKTKPKKKTELTD